MPFILSNRDEDRKIFEAMINKTMASFFRTMGDGKAFSGIDPYSLRRKVKEMGFLPEKGIGFDAALSKVEETVLANLLRTWSTSYMPHLHSPALLETICSELLIASFNDSMDSWDQGPAATEVEEAVIGGLLSLFGYPEGSDGTFTSGGSQSNISAIIAARDYYLDRVFSTDTKKKGMPPEYSTL
ncbi:MAG: diaminobutyrate decarboxylase, partial [Sphaerochaetaceae bacterium]|nr:diaminobutyrate decarboxylase [Sphaerochaetaceae bacterium]